MKKRGVSGTKKLSKNQKVSGKKNHKRLAIGIFIIIIIGLILYFIGGEITNKSQQKGFKQSKIGKNTCFLDTLALNFGTNDIFTCDTDDDCINSLKDYHKSTDIPLPSQDILERVECLPQEIKK